MAVGCGGSNGSSGSAELDVGDDGRGDCKNCVPSDGYDFRDTSRDGGQSDWDHGEDLFIMELEKEEQQRLESQEPYAPCKGAGNDSVSEDGTGSAWEADSQTSFFSLAKIGFCQVRLAR